MRNHQEENEKLIRELINQQPTYQPSYRIRQKVMASIIESKERTFETQRVLHPGFRVVMSCVLAISLFFLLWGIIKPGIVLQWNIYGDMADVFRIYRAPADLDQRVLVGEYESDTGDGTYQFIDLFVPIRNRYRYDVEARTSNGKLLGKQAVIVDAFTILPSQVAIFLYSLFFGWFIWLFLQRLVVANIIGKIHPT
jgi:hypothetical protein